MFGFLSFLLILFLLILLIGFSILGKILRVLFGSGYRSSNYQNRTYTNRENFNRQQDKQDGYAQAETYSDTLHNSKSNRKKIFDDDEGEYVDFEEQ